MSPKEQQLPKRASELLPKLNQWPDMERVTVEDALDIEYIFQEVERRIVRSKFHAEGKHAAYFCKVVLPASGECFNLLVGQSVLVDQIDQLVELGNVPFMATITRPDRYYTLV